ncbi:MAG: hypothetical protein DRQ24_06300 [Candidatus Latescibacterota bacterium]|nr:MAG: hypothetical protein DRQ24_06300 [Candidatus Latescibacterota bacterium]
MKKQERTIALKGLRINRQSCLLQTFCHYADRQEGVYRKAFLTAKFAKKSQRSQRGNYPLNFHKNITIGDITDRISLYY